MRREAETLVAAGYEVRVTSAASDELPRFEETRGVGYERIVLQNGRLLR